MSQAEGVCPNCGYHLVDLRHDRQTAGSRIIILHWSICRSCRHVALRAWEWDDTALESRFQAGNEE